MKQLSQAAGVVLAFALAIQAAAALLRPHLPLLLGIFVLLLILQRLRRY